MPSDPQDGRDDDVIEDEEPRMGDGRPHRVKRSEVVRIRATTVISMLIQGQDQRANSFQSVMGMFFHAANTPEKVIKTLSHVGICISLTSIHRAVRSLSAKAEERIRELGQTRLVSYAYNNFELILPSTKPTAERPGDGLLHMVSGLLLRLEHGATLEDLRCSDLLWDRNELNVHASDPRPFDAHKTLLRLATMYPEGTRAPNQLSRRGQFRAYHCMKILFLHGPACLRDRLEGLADPEDVEKIPLVKLDQTPLRTMELNQSKVSENLRALEMMYKQAGIGDSSKNADLVDISEYVTVVHGDLGTFQKVIAVLRRRSEELTACNRFQGVVCVPGLFHFKMAASDGIWRIYANDAKARVDETSFMKIAHMLRPKESSMLANNAKFRQQHDLIKDISTVLLLNAWQVEVERRTGITTLDAWAATKPTTEDIQKIARTIVTEYIEGGPGATSLEKMSGEDDSKRDKARENNMQLLSTLLLYEELSYAMNAGDIGRVLTLFSPWIKIFRAVGKTNYANYTLRFVHALEFIYTDRLREIVKYSMLVNPTGKPGAYRAVDWMVELLNLYEKVVYGGEGSNFTIKRIKEESVLVLIYRNSHSNVETNFKLPGLTTTHGDPDMTTTFASVLERLRDLHPNKFVAGRRSAYMMPHYISKGGSMLVEDPEREREGAEAEAELEERPELDEEQNLDADDLSVETFIG
ncbi:uncharacterized protein BXZ73DRAFT_92716 [Epithele typhae]|uniref:uncharacterized protein n=1 Tax=Epithele typhae TaxID=378194 RepID=UPI0020076013|nr:uncharacterized protein BXZ73DRAFT_92716 [Epithele typhae]KAH9914881.1 hypothetical protein BXZ73DRAFT_92716 [Epithele typhae]